MASVTTGRWALIQAGCAECGDSPLMVPGGLYDSPQAAAAAAKIEKWSEHPNGGYYTQSGSGATWLVPLDALATVADFDMEAYGGWTVDKIAASDLA